jgi:hypothetical protein
VLFISAFSDGIRESGKLCESWGELKFYGVKKLAQMEDDKFNMT